MEYGVDISPTVLSEREFATWSPFTARVKKEGVILYTGPG